MNSAGVFLIMYQLFMLSIISNEAVKIGVSKPLTTTTTTTVFPVTTMETETEEISTAASSTAIVNTDDATTTTKPMMPETEWPEFPPKKNSKPLNKITTTKPFTTTNKPITTTLSQNDLNNDAGITHKIESPAASFPSRPIEQNFCFCDLTEDFCDINCCCDNDCPAEAIKAFHCLSETSSDLEIYKERFENFKFQHGLPSCERNDGWLCVFRTNMPIAKRETFQYLEDTSLFYKWPNLLLESEEMINREFYKFGDPIRIINMATNEIQNFDLPSSFESALCRIQEPLYHLKPVKRSCLITSYENLKNAQLKLLELKEKYKILNAPNIPNDIFNHKHLQQNFIGNITICKCFEKKNNCTCCERDKDYEKNYQLLFMVKVNILHNFTHIQEAIIDLWLKDVNVGNHFNSTINDYWLAYETEFVNKTFKEFIAKRNIANQKLNKLSGPLGYLKGKPLIIAQYEALNKSQPLSTTNKILNYFSTNNTSTNTIILLAKENGECKRSEPVTEIINYGINVANYCKIKFKNNTLQTEEPTSTNFTEICLTLQQHIYDQLFGQDLIVENLSSYFISQIGRPQNISNKWLPLEVFNTDFNSVVGQYLHDTNTFVCRNMLLSVFYEFHIATSTVDNIPLQNVINRAILHLVDRHDLEFSLSENLEVPVTMMVRFFDVLEQTGSACNNLKYFNLIYHIILVLGFFYFNK